MSILYCNCQPPNPDAGFYTMIAIALMFIISGVTVVIYLPFLIRGIILFQYEKLKARRRARGNRGNAPAPPDDSGDTVSGSRPDCPMEEEAPSSGQGPSGPTAG